MILIRAGAIGVYMEGLRLIELRCGDSEKGSQGGCSIFKLGFLRCEISSRRRWGSFLGEKVWKLKFG